MQTEARAYTDVSVPNPLRSNQLNFNLCRKRVRMTLGIPLRDDSTAFLFGQAKNTKDAAQARRLLAPAETDGPRSDTARIEA